MQKMQCDELCQEADQSVRVNQNFLKHQLHLNKELDRRKQYSRTIFMLR